jgi:NADP-dependent 3-hydroxy acid dehydrogenase YdfG
MAAALNDTVALVTGASSGIGEATARALAAEGAAVAIVARRRDRLDELSGRIESDGGKALVLEADVGSREQAQAAVQHEEWETMLSVNVAGLLYCAHAALPHLLRAAEDGPRGVSDVVNISSVAGRVARLGSGVYNLTKHGVGAFSESLRQEVTERHVRVSLVEPGAVSTELSSHNRPEIQERIAGAFGDIERLESEDIAHAITYIVTRPPHVAINELLIRPTEQQR